MLSFGSAAEPICFCHQTYTQQPNLFVFHFFCKIMAKIHDLRWNQDLKNNTFKFSFFEHTQTQTNFTKQYMIDIVFKQYAVLCLLYNVHIIKMIHYTHSGCIIWQGFQCICKTQILVKLKQSFIFKYYCAPFSNIAGIDVGLYSLGFHLLWGPSS